ncbi:MAG: hypothetical protein ACFFDP_07225 [Promethearchaeota archaeon]
MGSIGDNLQNASRTKWIVCSLGIVIFGWYLIANIIRILSDQLYGFPMSQIYTTIFALPIIGWVYLLFSEQQLYVRRSALSIYAAGIIAVFLIFAIFFIITKPLFEVFVTGIFDHTFFPIAFGLLCLCDLRKINWPFWALFFPFGIFNFMPSINVISQVLFDVTVFGFGCPGLFDFFGPTVTSKAELIALFWANYPSILDNLGYYLREQFTFFTLFPFVIVYYLIKAVQNRPI